MKKKLLICLTFLTVQGYSQDEAYETKPEDNYNLFMSAGSHIGLWALILEQDATLKNLPYNIQVDKLFNRKYVLGVGYTNDVYPNSPLLAIGPNENIRRHNFRIRFYTYLNEQEKFFSIYIGASAGVSYWTLNNITSDQGYNKYWPTAQFLFGMKVKLTDTFFWQTELGVGPPYACQSSIGVKF